MILKKGVLWPPLVNIYQIGVGSYTEIKTFRLCDRLVNRKIDLSGSSRLFLLIVHSKNHMTKVNLFFIITILKRRDCYEYIDWSNLFWLIVTTPTTTQPHHSSWFGHENDFAHNQIYGQKNCLVSNYTFIYCLDLCSEYFFDVSSYIFNEIGCLSDPKAYIWRLDLPIGLLSKVRQIICCQIVNWVLIWCSSFSESSLDGHLMWY